MRRIDDEDATRAAGAAGGDEVASGGAGVFAQRPVRLGAAAPFLATKGARARTEHAQGDHEGTTPRCFDSRLCNQAFRCLQLMDTEEADIAQLCAQNIVLWQHFLEAFSGREAVHQHLARIHHQLRVSGQSPLILSIGAIDLTVGSGLELIVDL